MGEEDTSQGWSTLGSAWGIEQWLFTTPSGPLLARPTNSPSRPGGGQGGQMDTPGQSGPQDLVGEAMGRDLQLGRQGWGASPGWVGVVNSTTPGKGRPGQEGSGGLSDCSQLRQPPWLPEYRLQTCSSLASTPKRLTQLLTPRYMGP